jgi:CBS-domain-containing membrane protein
VVHALGWTWLRHARRRSRRRQRLRQIGDDVARVFDADREADQAVARLEDLLPIFRADHVPPVLDGDKFLGLITRTDLLNYLKRRMK